MLGNNNVQLRPIEEPDIASFGYWRNQEHIRQYTRGFRPLTMSNQRKWFEHLTDDPSTVMFSIIVEERLVGCCGLTYINWKEGFAEASIYMEGKKWREEEAASETLQMLLHYGFCELRLHRIYRVVYAYNEGGKTFLTKNGFILEGKHREARFWNGGYHDELVYGILAPEFFES